MKGNWEDHKEVVPLDDVDFRDDLTTAKGKSEQQLRNQGSGTEEETYQQISVALDRYQLCLQLKAVAL